MVTEYTNLKGVVKGKFLYNDGTQQWDTEVKVTKMDIQVLYDFALEEENKHLTGYFVAREIAREIIEEFQAKPKLDEDKIAFVKYFAKGCSYTGTEDIFDKIVYDIAVENFIRESEAAYGAQDVVNKIDKKYQYWYRIRKQCEHVLGLDK